MELLTFLEIQQIHLTIHSQRKKGQTMVISMSIYQEYHLNQL